MCSRCPAGDLQGKSAERGLFAQHTRLLALMVSADRVPNRFADNDVPLTFDGVSRLAG